MCKVGKREQLIFWDKVRCFFGTIHFSAAPKSLSCSVKIEWATFACQLLWDFLSCSEWQKQSMQCIVFTDQPHSLYSPYSFCPITPIQIHNIYSLYRLCFMFKLPETTCFQQAGWKAYGLSLFSHSQWPENLSHLRSSAKKCLCFAHMHCNLGGKKMTGNATNFQIFVETNCSLKNNKMKQHFKKWPEIRQMLSVDIWLSKWEDPLLWAPVVACLISTEQLRNSQSNWKTIVTCSILTEQLRYLGAAEKCMVPKKHLP